MLQQAKTQNSKDVPHQNLEELFEPLPKGVKLATKIDEVADQIASLKKQYDFLMSKERAAAVEDINAKIAKLGITANDLDFGTSHVVTSSKSNRAGFKVPVKYKHGANAWSGRGRQPKWLVDYIAGGGVLEDLLVK